MGAWLLLHTRVPLSQGNPKPQASWTHNGHAVDSQRVSVRTGQQDSILFIRSAQRSDSGCYELTVKLEDQEAKATVHILVIGMCREAARQGPSHPPPPSHTSYCRADLMGSSQGRVRGARPWVRGSVVAPTPLPVTLWSCRET